MQRLKQYVQQRLRKLKRLRIQADEDGQGLVEYALILVLVAIAALLALQALGAAVSDTYERVVCELEEAQLRDGGNVCAARCELTFDDNSITTPTADTMAFSFGSSDCTNSNIVAANLIGEGIDITMNYVAGAWEGTVSGRADLVTAWNSPPVTLNFGFRVYHQDGVGEQYNLTVTKQ